MIPVGLSATACPAPGRAARRYPIHGTNHCRDWAALERDPCLEGEEKTPVAGPRTSPLG